MADEGIPLHAKPNGGVGNYIVPGHQLIVTNPDAAGPSNMHNVLMQGKPLEDLASISATMAGFNRPLVVISQERDSDFSGRHSHDSGDTPMGGATDFDRQSQLSEGVNGTADNATSVNNPISGIPPAALTQNVTPATGQDFSMAFYQQQVMLNHQLFIQQQQTVSALIGKVDGLAKLVENNGEKQKASEAKREEKTRVKQLGTGKQSRKTHVLSDSDIEDVSSDSDFGYSEDDEGQSDNSDLNASDKKDDKKDNETEASDLRKSLQNLAKELERNEAVGPNVDDTLSKIVNLGIRSVIDRKKSKELCETYVRPENCSGLVVPKINKELWNTSSLAKVIKDEDKEYQLAQRYVNQGMIPLVQLVENMLTETNMDKNFKLAKDALQLLTYAHRDMSNLRRQRIKTVVTEKYRPLCNESTPLTENLLGDELEKQIKTMDEMQKVGKGVIKKPWKRKYKSGESTSERPSKFQKFNNFNSSRFRNKDNTSFLEKRSRHNHHKSGQHKRKNQKQ